MISLGTNHTLAAQASVTGLVACTVFGDLINSQGADSFGVLAQSMLSASMTTLVPAASGQRLIKSIAISNTNAGAVVVKFAVNGFQLVTMTLPADGSATYTDGEWCVYNAAGIRLFAGDVESSGGSGGSGSSGPDWAVRTRIPEGETVTVGDGRVLLTVGSLVNDGDLIIQPGGQVIELPENFGGPGVDGYLHTQASALSTWTVNHNFGYRPVVSVYSVGGMEVSADVLHVSENQLQINFDFPYSGFARAV